MENRDSDILDENTQRTSGTSALVSNIEAAKAVASIVKTTLGPMGMDKMLIDSLGDSIVTNDGVKILKEMEIEHPGAKLLVEVAKTQESEVGDGTTTAVILSGELLAKAQELGKMKIHPTAITRGYKKVSEKALEILDGQGIRVDPKHKELLKDICSTAMTGKVAEFSKDKLSELIYSAVIQVEDGNRVPIERIKIQKAVGGEIEESDIIDGIVLDKNPANVNMPERIDNAKVLLVDFPLEVKELDASASVNIASAQDYEDFMKSEESYLADIVEKIVTSGANVVIAQKGIDDSISYFLAKRNILAVRRTRKSDMEKLSFALGKSIVSNLEDIEEDSLGDAKEVTIRNILGENYIFVSGCENPKALTIFLKASTSHILDEIERAVDDALGDINSVFKSSKIVAGGGAIELELHRQLLEYSKSLPGKEQIIAKAYAESFLAIPRILCENSGFDEIETIAELMTMHDKKHSKAGIDSFQGVVKDTILNKIVEPISIKSQAIKSATESSSMILRIDDVIAAKRLTPTELNEF